MLKFKYQVLEELKREHGVIISAVMQKEAEILILKNSYRRGNEAFAAEKEKGMSVLDALSFDSHIHYILHNIEKEQENLDELRIEENVKRQEVIVAKTEIASFEKLKGKRMEEYNEALRKLEERFIEEFVSNKTFAQKR